MKKAVEKTIFRVAGVTNYKKAVKQACNDIAEDNGIPEYAKYYGDLSAKEIREEVRDFSNQIFKYHDLSVTDVELIPEPNNKFDSNAIKVLIFDNFVGYVPSKKAKNIRHYFDDDRYTFIVVAEIKGGPFKEWDEYEEKVVVNNDLDIGFEVYLTIIDSSQKEEVQSEVTETVPNEIAEEEIQLVEPIETEITEPEHIESDTTSDEFNLTKVSPKKKLKLNKIIFSALYIFLLFFGIVGIPIAPFLAVPLTAWSFYKLCKLFKK